MNIKTQKGRVYAVTASGNCTVSTDQGVLLCQVAAGAQACFVAPGHEVVVSDESALVTLCEDFNAAPMAASGGGGASIFVDHAFSATSENAQSGKAVAGAFGAFQIKNKNSTVCMGLDSSVAAYDKMSITIGPYAKTGNYSAPIAIGAGAVSNGDGGISFGTNSTSTGTFAVALGARAIIKNKFTTVIGCFNSDDNTLTQLYVMAAGSTLANTYEDGAACLGYIVKSLTDNTILECGTRKMSELFTNNTAFAPAALGLDDEPTPGPFLPTGILEPMEPECFTEG